ncbi:MAG TPA: c-type cytochrome [Gemmatimonadaceae bacterium]|nr:c-type cytochrome [Gemmatimonadaceae bacterium]
MRLRGFQVTRRGRVWHAAPAVVRSSMRLAAVAVLAVIGCGRPHNGMHGQATGASTGALPDLGMLTRMPMGPLPGMQMDSARLTIVDPYAGDQAAIKEGDNLFVRMNCAYCHGFTGQGGMGPDLTDNYWRYGGDDASVFQSIYAGRAKGMPAWGRMLSEDQIWKLVAYVRTLNPGTGQQITAREPNKSINEDVP